MIHSWATEEDDLAEDERFGRVGKQRIQDTGPLTTKRMETIDDDTTAAAYHGWTADQHQAWLTDCLLRLLLPGTRHANSRSSPGSRPGNPHP